MVSLPNNVGNTVFLADLKEFPNYIVNLYSYHQAFSHFRPVARPHWGAILKISFSDDVLIIWRICFLRISTYLDLGDNFLFRDIDIPKYFWLRSVTRFDLYFTQNLGLPNNKRSLPHAEEVFTSYRALRHIFLSI